jgi:DNA-binding PucR family transcriptional regulator
LLLVPEVEGVGRQHLLRVLAGRHAVVGPPRPWLRARLSYDRATRVATLVVASDGRPVDSEEHLAELIVGADRDALDDLRARVLAPLAGLRAGTRENLEATLRSWLLLQGRRDAVAAELHVHPQTVRYRMGQLRDLYGDRLDDPAAVLDLLLALTR